MANDGVLLVNFGEMAQAGAAIQKAVMKLEADLADLEKIGGELSATWEGKAKQAYEDRQRTWQNASRDLQTILQNIRVAVEKSTDDYASTEQQATQRFQ